MDRQAKKLTTEIINKSLNTCRGRGNVEGVTGVKKTWESVVNCVFYEIFSSKAEIKTT